MVLRGSLRLPTAGQYVRNALTELGTQVTKTNGAVVDMPIDSHPEPSASRNKGTTCGAIVSVIEQGGQGGKPNATN